MIIYHNLPAMNAHRQLKLDGFQLDKSIEKLSSGMRINRASDDASGLAVSEKMRAQIRGLHRAAMNGQDMISLIQTAEGYLSSTQEVLHRIRELAVQAANGVYTDEDRNYIQTEVDQLVDEVDRIASHAQFNRMNILTGRFANTADAVASMWVHIGANMDQNERVYIGTMTAQALGIYNPTDMKGVSIATQDSANMTIGVMDVALERVSKQRTDLGAYQNRIEYAVKGVMIGEENLQFAESRIRDTDMASEIVNFTTFSILTQAATSMLAQANFKNQGVLRLLQ